MVKVSVIVPAHNEERYIGDCVAAILREASRAPFPVEVIVVDNASVDATAAVAAGFRGVRVVSEPAQFAMLTLRYKVHGGVAAATLGMERVLERMAKTKTNADFLSNLNRDI